MAKRKGAKSWRRSEAAHRRCMHSLGKERNFNLAHYVYHNDCIRAIPDKQRVLSENEKRTIYRDAQSKSNPK